MKNPPGEHADLGQVRFTLEADDNADISQQQGRDYGGAADEGKHTDSQRQLSDEAQRLLRVADDGSPDMEEAVT